MHIQKLAKQFVVQTSKQFIVKTQYENGTSKLRLTLLAKVIIVAAIAFALTTSPGYSVLAIVGMMISESPVVGVLLGRAISVMTLIPIV